jgi:two-component system CheB/CheR fusion protein
MVLQTFARSAIEAQNGAVHPSNPAYRTQENGVEGVVITFADITERKRGGRAGGQAAGESGECREIAFSRPRPTTSASQFKRSHCR